MQLFNVKTLAGKENEPMEKTAVTQYPIHDLIKDRWSPRAFSARAIEMQKLLSLFEAARWTPSSMNAQPWSFILATADQPEAHQRMVAVLGERNQLWAKNAPALILAIAKIERQPGSPNRHAWYDLGQAVAQLSLQATAEGLSLHQMGGFDAEKARELFAIPHGYEAVVSIAIGYRGDPEELPEDLQAREREPRSRKPVSEFVFQNAWNQPVQEKVEPVIA
jgi:nitroreductase